MTFSVRIWMKPYRMQRSWKNSTRAGRPVSLHRAQWHITLSKRFDLTFEYAYHSKYSHKFEVILDLWLYLSLRADSLFVVTTIFLTCNLFYVTSLILITDRFLLNDSICAKLESFSKIKEAKKKRADTHRNSCEHLPSGMEALQLHPNNPAYVDVYHKLCASVFKNCAISGFCSKRISSAASDVSSPDVLTRVSL